MEPFEADLMEVVGGGQDLAMVADSFRGKTGRSTVVTEQVGAWLSAMEDAGWVVSRLSGRREVWEPTADGLRVLRNFRFWRFSVGGVSNANRHTIVAGSTEVGAPRRFDIFQVVGDLWRIGRIHELRIL
jgi:hypothetical protein